MIKEIKGDILELPKDVLIVHQVNCQGVMGSGLALQIKQKFYSVYENYKEKCHSTLFKFNSANNLGDIQICFDNSSSKGICNLFGQNYYGKNIRHTNYEAFYSALEKLKIYLETNNNLEVAFPYKIGCGFGGAEWVVIKSMIETVFVENKYIVYIVRKDNNA